MWFLPSACARRFQEVTAGDGHDEADDGVEQEIHQLHVKKGEGRSGPERYRTQDEEETDEIGEVES